MRRIFFGLALLLATSTPGSAATIDDAQALWLKGNYAEALETYAAVEEGPAGAIALGKSRCLRSQGQYAEAEQLLTGALVEAPEDADLLAERADLHLFRGAFGPATELARKAIAANDDHLPARWVLARVLSETGAYDEANEQFEWFIRYYNDRQPDDAESLLLVAQAAAEFARWNKAPDEFDFILNTLLADAESANEAYWPAHWYAGMLLLEKYNQADGVPELQTALRINASAAEALVGLGMAALRSYDFKKGNRFADLALEVNPNLPDALCLKADLLLADDRTEEAIERLETALTINPNGAGTLGRLAACRHVLNQSEQARDLETRALALNPKPGVFYAAAADPLEKRRQFAQAETYYRKAIEAAPHLAGPLNGLGMLLMRVGEEDEAKEVFAKARDLDPFHVRVLNMTKVLDHMEDYKVIRTDHYDVVVRADLDDLLGKFASRYLERTHAQLCKRFGYEPPERTKIEVLIDHKWFSARVVGLPRIGTVGACTGKVVALASPRSLKTPYNWARVLTHEVTHIITLQQTKFNIPHWFTEALAVHSEGYPRPQVWNRLLSERVPKGELFDLNDINHAFVRPKTPLDWQMAYCQSLLYAEYMMSEYGEETIAKLLDAYRDGLATPAAIEKVFGVEQGEFEAGYRDYLKELVAGLKTGPQRRKRSFAESEKAFRDDPEDADAAAELALHHARRRGNRLARELAETALRLRPNHPMALYVLARMELSIGKTDEALALLEPGFDPKDPNEMVLDLLAGIRVRRKEYEQAAALYERARQADPLESKWVGGLARVYLLQNDRVKLVPVLETLAAMDADDLKARKKLAELAVAAKDWERAEHWAFETLYVDVSDRQAHGYLADAALALGKFELAIDECRILLAKNPVDVATSMKLAEAYLGAGRKELARPLLEAVPENDPNHERARRLLKDANDS